MEVKKWPQGLTVSGGHVPCTHVRALGVPAQMHCDFVFMGPKGTWPCPPEACGRCLLWWSSLWAEFQPHGLKREGAVNRALSWVSRGNMLDRILSYMGWKPNSDCLFVCLCLRKQMYWVIQLKNPGRHFPITLIRSSRKIFLELFPCLLTLFLFVSDSFSPRRSRLMTETQPQESVPPAL